MLSSTDPEPIFVVNPGASSPFVMIGDHAGRVIPAGLGDLGLSPAEMHRHIAWDIGVQALGEALSEALGATFIAQRYSRLVVDCNRDPGRADAFVEASDGVVVPGNQGLTASDRAERVAAIFAPYHARIAAELDAREGRPTLVIALHSFTPVFGGFTRPWRFGVLHLGESAFSQAMLAVLREAEGEALVGDNAPYSMDDVDYSVPHHAISRGLDYLELEVRQDLIADPKAALDLASRLTGLLEIGRARIA